MLINFEAGLQAMSSELKGTDSIKEFTIYESALLANLQTEKKYGSTETLRHERSRLVEQLNELALNILGISFNKLCQISSLAKHMKTNNKELASTISILFLAADPANASRLRLGKEFREIQEKLRLAKLREQFRLELPQLSLRPMDVSQALLDARPQIVHFSGHGASTGALCFENEAGQIQFVSPEALAALFEQFSNEVDCVLLNACYSEIQAQAIGKHIKYVIGMNQAIGDEAAIAFSTGFYQALGAGRSVEDAYKFGCVQIRLQGIPEHLIPVLCKG